MGVGDEARAGAVRQIGVAFEISHYSEPFSAAVRPAVATAVCSAVEISRRISDQTCYGRCSVRSVGEMLQHGLVADGIQPRQPLADSSCPSLEKRIIRWPQVQIGNSESNLNLN